MEGGKLTNDVQSILFANVPTMQCFHIAIRPCILQIEESYEYKNCSIEISSLFIVKASSYTQIKTQIPSLRACSVSHLILELQVHNSI